MNVDGIRLKMTNFIPAQFYRDPWGVLIQVSWYIHILCPVRIVRRTNNVRGSLE